MGKGLLLVTVSALFASACGGEAQSLPSDYFTYGFMASVQVDTTNPQPGRPVTLNVAVKSVGNTPVHCDVTLRVVSATGNDIYDQHWDDMLFMPQDEWNLTNGFLPSTDVEKTYHFEVEVRRHDNGELLQDTPNAGTLTF